MHPLWLSVESFSKFFFAYDLPQVHLHTSVFKSTYKISVFTSVGDSDLDPQDPNVFGGTDPALDPDPSLFS
jgi:hypothetical protein